MKKFTYSFLLIAAWCSLFSGCAKESVQPIDQQQVETQYVVHYSIDGVQFTALITGQEDWQHLISSLLKLTKEGHRVAIKPYKVNKPVDASKEKVTFVSCNINEVTEWVTEMTDQGYDVTVYYNKETGEYTCIAVIY